ncbi:MAG TPA: alpha/beta hydrolase-fold protein, partial [Polyangia bacterium]
PYALVELPLIPSLPLGAIGTRVPLSSKLLAALARAPQAGTAALLDGSGRTIEQIPFRARSSALQFATRATGLLRVRLALPAGIAEDEIFVGPVEPFVKQLDDSPVASVWRPDLDAYRKRYAILVAAAADPSGRENKVASWQRRMVWLLGRAEEHLRLAKEQTKRADLKPGTFLVSYRSTIDRSEQQALVHVPRAYDSGKPIPLATIVPYQVTPALPFLKSGALAYVNTMARQIAAAERAGVALMWIGARETANCMPIASTEILIAIRALSRRLRLDPAQSHLSGWSLGGRCALVTAARYPGRFAKISVFAPPLHPHPLAGDAKTGKDGWDRLQNPLRLVDRFRRHSVRIVVGEDDPGPLKVARAFAAAGDAVAPEDLVVLPDADHHYAATEVSDRLYEFFAKPLPPADGSLPAIVEESFAAEAGGVGTKVGLLQGPVARAFASPFVIVSGTGGTSTDQRQIEVWRRRLCGGWQRDFFTDCPSTSDRGLSAQMRSEKNLVLIGDARSNAEIARLGDRLPIAWRSDGISLGGTSFRGSGIGVVFCVPNPENLGRYVVIVSGANLPTEVDAPWNPAVDGFYDFRLSGSAEGHVEGSFDRHWSKLLPRALSPLAQR